MKILCSITPGICATILLVLSATAGDLTKRSNEYDSFSAANTEPRQLVPVDVKALAKAGVDDYTINYEIRNSRAIFHLTSADIIDLKNSGVSEEVIDTMIGTAISPARNAATQSDQEVTPADIKALGKARINEHIIMNQIETSHAVFHLGSADIIDLKSAGVSDRVINLMIKTASSSDKPLTPTSMAGFVPVMELPWVEGNRVIDAGWTWLTGSRVWSLPPSRAVWISAHWSRDRSGHRCRVPGYWAETSPPSHPVWVVGYWTRDQSGDLYRVPGYWAI